MPGTKFMNYWVGLINWLLGKCEIYIQLMMPRTNLYKFSSYTDFFPFTVFAQLWFGLSSISKVICFFYFRYYFIKLHHDLWSVEANISVEVLIGEADGIGSLNAFWSFVAPKKTQTVVWLSRTITDSVFILTHWDLSCCHLVYCLTWVLFQCISYLKRILCKISSSFHEANLILLARLEGYSTAWAMV